jgi:hypothetical protein
MELVEKHDKRTIYNDGFHADGDLPSQWAQADRMDLFPDYRFLSYIPRGLWTPEREEREDPSRPPTSEEMSNAPRYTRHKRCYLPLAS